LEDKQDSPSQLLERAELEKLISVAIDRMPHTERTVLSLYYHEELSLREIAGILEVHLSRVSQLKTQAILRLRVLMQQRWPATGARRSDGLNG
jgi:RNA polymerase sigma factor for flagellar operon FliA